MKVPNRILEKKEILSYLMKRNLLKQYKKSTKYILQWMWKSVDLKKREPKEDEILYFKINNQYRAFCFFDKDFDLIVFKIDDHQN